MKSGAGRALAGFVGFTRLWPSIWTIVAMIGNLWLLSIAMRSLPAGTAYATWVGIGAVGIALPVCSCSVSLPHLLGWGALR